MEAYEGGPATDDRRIATGGRGGKRGLGLPAGTSRELTPPAAGRK